MADERNSELAPSATIPFDRGHVTEQVADGVPLELVVVSGASMVRQVVAAGGRIVVGRSADCDLRLPDPNVSRHHVAVCRDHDAVFLEDLGSSNGTRMGGTKLATGERRPLALTEAVELGSSMLMVRPLSSATAQHELVPCVLDAAEQPRLAALARSEGPLAIVGPPGSGKHAVAQALHELSGRGAVPLREVALDALDVKDASRVLFGDVGSRDDEGVLDQAHGGSLVVTGIDAVPERVQLRLVDASERGQFSRDGSTSLRQIDVRLVLVCHDAPDRLLRLGALARRLVHRLSGRIVELRGLDERREALPEIIADMMRRSGRGGELSSEDLDALAARRWPGNLRELSEVLGTALEGGRLPSAGGEGAAADDAQPRRRRVLEALDRCRGNQTAAAKLLGVSRRTLINWLDHYEIPRPRKGG